jgi:acetyl-CoA C-acetyltransferase
VSEVWVIDSARTPRAIGKIGKGAYSDIHPQRLLSTVLRALVQRNHLETRDVDDVIVGCGSQFGKQGLCIGRMAALDAGIDAVAPAVTIDRFCGSGLTAVNMAAVGIMAGIHHLAIAGGVESMSHASTLSGLAPMDSGNLDLRESFPQPHQGICADLIATLERISREELDTLAVESQTRAGIAVREERFRKSLVPVYHSDGRLALNYEEFPRPNTTLNDLAKLAPAFRALYDLPMGDPDLVTCRDLVEQAYPDMEIDHVHHAGNSSGVVDGAGAVLLASPEYAKAHGLKPRARIKSMATVGDDPTLMLNAPKPATEKALKQAGMSINDIDLFEINEAFAVVPLKYMRDFHLDPETVNVNGGAIAFGHPIGATGAMLLGVLLDEMERRDLNIGLVSLCAAGGMAPATIVERI